MIREDKAIDQFCKRLSLIEKHTVRVIARPDKDRPGQGGCDAIIERGGRHFALEHTTIDSFSGQRADDARFKQVFVSLEQAIRSAFPDSYIRIAVPVNAVPTGTDWSELSKQLEDECIKAISHMPFKEHFQEFRFDKIPFPVWIAREEDRDNPECQVMRRTPSDSHAQLVDIMERAIRDKTNQLAPYRAKGLPTILLLDSDDFVLVNRNTLAQALCGAANQESTEGLDEIFIVDGHRNPVWFYPVKLYDRIYPDLPEFEQFRHAHYVLTYGGGN